MSHCAQTARRQVARAVPLNEGGEVVSYGEWGDDVALAQFRAAENHGCPRQSHRDRGRRAHTVRDCSRLLHLRRAFRFDPCWPCAPGAKAILPRSLRQLQPPSGGRLTKETLLLNRPHIGVLVEPGVW